MRDQGIRGQGELDIPLQVIIEIFTADTAIGFVDAFHNERDIGQALEDHFFTDAEKTVHKHVLRMIGKD